MQRKKIVIADDVELFLMLEKSFFNRDEFELITARNGEETLKAIRETKPDLVFLDLYMPDMNGDECCRLVKDDESCRHIPIVIVTTAGREEDLERCRNAGCNDIVHKPINRHDFMATAQRHLQVEERGTPRFNTRLLVHYCTSSHDLLSDYSIDLSPGGLFLATEHVLPSGTELSMEFGLSASKGSIRCKARVAWVNNPNQRKKAAYPTGMGVQFLDLTPADMDAIHEFIKE